MREILFRGKRVDNGEWVEGYLVVAYNPMVDENKSFIIENPAFYYGFSEFAIVTEVIPETVGQYTGLTDKNGNKIFEGDIVEFTDKYTGEKGRAEIVFEYFKWKYSGCYYGGNPIVWLCIDDTSVEFEVIGNIHDNGEILEEKK